MVGVHTYPPFEFSDAVPLLANTADREQKLGLCPEIPSLTLTWTLANNIISLYALSLKANILIQHI